MQCSPPEVPSSVPTETAHPCAPQCTGPELFATWIVAWTVKDVDASFPWASLPEPSLTVDRSQSPWLLSMSVHSTIASVLLGGKPIADTRTLWPS